MEEFICIFKSHFLAWEQRSRSLSHFHLLTKLNPPLESNILKVLWLKLLCFSPFPLILFTGLYETYCSYPHFKEEERRHRPLSNLLSVTYGGDTVGDVGKQTYLNVFAVVFWGPRGKQWLPDLEVREPGTRVCASDRFTIPLSLHTATYSHKCIYNY